MWKTFLFQPLLNALIAFYHLFGNLGAAIFSLTISLRTFLLPLTLPSLKTAKKMKEIAPQLEKLKEKYEDDKEALAKAQMDLYREEGIRPFAGFIPQIIQIVILIALYQAFRRVLGNNGGVTKLNEMLYSILKLPENTELSLNFWYLKLTDPDTMYAFVKTLGIEASSFLKKVPGVFLFGAAIAQFLSAKVMMPAVEKEKEVAKETEDKSDDFASMMRTQSIYMFPLMTLLIGTQFPSGLVLYWFTFSLFNLGQQFIIRKLRK